MTSSQALEKLMDGNARFVAGFSRFGPMTGRRAELVSGQNPFAMVLGCADSRVPIETIFDQEPGNVFVGRVAGNTADAVMLGTLEYAVAHFSPALLLVLGHAHCGAVAAALDFARGGPVAPGYIQSVVDAIAPVARQTRDQPGDWSANAVAANAKSVAATIGERSQIIAGAVGAGAMAVRAGVYDLESGEVAILSL